MDPEDLLDAIDSLSPQHVLIISIANHLREAVGEGRVSSVVLTQDHRGRLMVVPWIVGTMLQEHRNVLV
jgi:hypothetical protein